LLKNKKDQFLRRRANQPLRSLIELLKNKVKKNNRKKKKKIVIIFFTVTLFNVNNFWGMVMRKKGLICTNTRRI
jgi:hypothetical protein